jgi:hypothetical protein
LRGNKPSNPASAFARAISTAEVLAAARYKFFRIVGINPINRVASAGADFRSQACLAW